MDSDKKQLIERFREILQRAPRMWHSAWVTPDKRPDFSRGSPQVDLEILRQLFFMAPFSDGEEWLPLRALILAHWTHSSVPVAMMWVHSIVVELGGKQALEGTVFGKRPIPEVAAATEKLKEIENG